MRKAGNAAVGLFVRLGVHATRHLTEGHLDGDIVRSYGTGPNIKKLVAVGMLHGHGHDCMRCPQPADGDFVIHDYLDYNKSRAQIEASREAARKRQNRGRETARANRNARDSERVSSPIRSRNGSDSAPNRERNDPLFDDEPAGHDDMSRRDTHEGVTVVPSPPLPSHNYDVADVGGGTTGSRAADLDAHAPTPIEIDGFQLTDAMRRWAKRDGYSDLVDIDHATAQFVSHYRSTAARRSSWPDAWQKWIRDDAKRATERGTRTQQGAFLVALPGGGQAPPRPSTTDARVQAALDLGRQMQAEYDAAHKEAQ
ncbi:hypothetical protein [Streptomyces stelliscabiei]|uniref:hypothetical protein n=1 Tax=Streptomyces stelliscabiei TaxID=146820 RepID=UPI0013317AB2|nr:hypothetical protein [Streptomyces stelliscabiei]